jgi:uncharacterized protein (TIGR03382 family)
VNGLWFAQEVVGALIGATITFCMFGALAWLWARRKLLPFLRAHPKLRAMLEDRE